MPLAQNKRLMADLPLDTPGQSRASNPAQRWVDSLDDEEQGNLDPGKKNHEGEINRIAGLIANGYLDQSRVEKLARLNPNAAGVFMSALAQSEGSREIKSAYTENFAPPRAVQNYIGLPDETGTPSPVMASGKANYDAAVLKLLSMGENERAKQLLEVKEKLGGKKGTFDSLDAAYAAIGVSDPRSATKAQHREALGLYQAPIVQQVAGPGGQKEIRVTPRGQALNTVTPTGENIFDDDLKALTAEVQKKGIPDVDVYVNDLDKLLESSRGDKQLGGLWNVSAAGFLKNQKGAELWATAQGMMGSIMRNSAGLSQTQGEAERVLNKLAMRAYNTFDDFYKAFQKVKRIYDGERAAIVAGARPEAVDIWEARNPITKLRVSPWKERELQKKSATKKKPESSRADEVLEKFRRQK